MAIDSGIGSERGRISRRRHESWRLSRWILCVAAVSPGWYHVSTQGAAARGEVETIDRALASARGDVRGLETEFAARANIAQLTRWNAETLALASPRAEQFVSEAGLAGLVPHAGRPAPDQLAMLDPNIAHAGGGLR